MNVGELKKMLEKYPDDMEILNSRYSDYSLMSKENKRLAKKYLHLKGN